MTTSYVLSKLQKQFGQLGDADPMRGYLSYGSLKVSDPERMSFIPKSPWVMQPLAQVMPRAVQDSLDGHEPVVLCFANTSWRLLIACRTVRMPDFGDGATFGSLHPTSTRCVVARLHPQAQGKKLHDSTPLRAWQAMIPLADDEAMTLFLSTALAQSLPISTLPCDGSMPPDDDGELPP